ncbi:MAG: tetratricopeptide repeat protein [Imperialibacter sp.]|uniref:tetratricopeptide repeat-containing sensor histidine kinase n=1 Tax=Imperialibacter sp. TaxID=2038411 RepID=UPI0032EC0BED
MRFFRWYVYKLLVRWSFATIFHLAFVMPAWSQTTSKFDSLKRRLDRPISELEKAEVYLTLAEEIKDVNIWMTPAYVDSAFKYSSALDYKKGVARAHFLYGVERWLNGYYAEAESKYHQSIRLFALLNDSSMLAKNFSYLGLCFHYHTAYDSALFYHQKALVINERLGDKRKMAHNIDNIALVHHQLANFPELIKYATKSLEIRNTIPGFTSRTNFYNFGGEIFRDRALREALAYHRKVLVAERKKKNGDLGSSLNNIGSVYYNNKKYDSAVYFLRLGAEEMLKSGTMNQYAGHLHELGEALRESGNYLDSERVFLEAMAIWDSIGTRHSVSIIRGNLARLYFLMGKYPEGLAYLDQSLAMVEGMAYNPFCIKLWSLKARYLMKLGQTDEALVLAHKSLTEAKKKQVVVSILNSFELLSELYSAIGNHEQAMFYMKEHTALKDRLFNGESSLQIAQLQVQYDTEKKNKEIELLNAQNTAQKAKLFQRELMVGLVSIAVLLFGFAYYKRQKYVRKLGSQKDFIDQQRIELALKNQEKDVLLGEIHHRVKNNLQIISSLLKLQSRQLTDKKAQNAVLEGRDRVKAMALIHQCLYQHDRFSSIQIDSYIKKLIDGLISSHGYSDSEIQLNYNLQELHLSVDTALPIGLIVNELVSNCFKHAFKKSRKNCLSLQFEKKGRKLLLVVKDNGIGIPDEGLHPTKVKSFGIGLIQSLVEELDGNVEFIRARGTTVKVFILKYSLHSARKSSQPSSLE